MLLTLTLLAIATFAATYLGGFFALRIKDKLHLVTGFSAGAVIGVAFFDLIPEAFDIVGPANTQTAALVFAIGFFLYLILDRVFMLHKHHEGDHHEHEHRGMLRAGSLSLHSLLDGVAVGLAFQVSLGVGAVVAIAVLAHDFSDGINTVSAIMKSGGERKQALRWLLIDACAPIVGIFATLLFSISTFSLGIILSLFAGFFLYIGASDLVPESFHAHPTKWTTVATVCGALFIFLAITFAV